MVAVSKAILTSATMFFVWVVLSLFNLEPTKHLEVPPTAGLQTITDWQTNIHINEAKLKYHPVLHTIL